MTLEEFETKFDNDEYYEEYSEFIMNNCHGDRIICNGHTLIGAIEDNYLYEEFKDSIIC
jgi:hypothetical protein